MFGLKRLTQWALLAKRAAESVFAMHSRARMDECVYGETRINWRKLSTEIVWH